MMTEEIFLHFDDEWYEHFNYKMCMKEGANFQDISVMYVSDLVDILELANHYITGNISEVRSIVDLIQSELDQNGYVTYSYIEKLHYINGDVKSLINRMRAVGVKIEIKV